MIIQKINRCSEWLIAWFSSVKSPLCLLAPAFLLVFGKLYFRGIADLDLFARVAMGRLIHLQGKIPLTDPFAYTPTKNIWYDHEWLSGVIFYGVSQIGADTGLFLLNLVLAFAAIYVVHLAQRQLTQERVFGAVWIFICILSCNYAWLSIVRARSFSVLFYALFLLGGVRFLVKGDRRLLYFLPLLMVAWANLHAGFVLGFGVLAVFLYVLILTKRQKVWLIAGCILCCALAVLINPYGFSYLRFVFDAISKDRSLITEWHALKLLSAEGLFYALVTGVLAFGIVNNRKRLTLDGYIILGICFLAGIVHQRFGVYYYLTAAIYGADLFAAMLETVKERFPKGYAHWRHGMVSAMVVFMLMGSFCVVLFLLKAPNYLLRYDDLPVRAVAWLRKNRDGGNVLTYFDEGSYVLWRGYPRFKVSLDGRYEEVYPDTTLDMVFKAFSVSYLDYKQYLEAVRPDYILICATSLPNLDHKRFGDSWPLIYKDDKCKILSQTANDDGKVGGASTTSVAIWKPVF